MAKAPLTLLVAAVVTVTIGLLDGQGWPSYVIGAVLAFSLWMMLFFGTWGTPTWVSPPVYAVAAVVGVLIGGVLVWVGDGNSVFWAVGFIVAGALGPASRLTRRDGTSA